RGGSSACACDGNADTHETRMIGRRGGLSAYDSRARSTHGMVTVVVLLSFLLVLAAAVTLVIGLLNSGLGLIYVSIGCSVASGIVLALAVVRNRPREGVATSVGTERLRALDTDVEPTVTVVSPRGDDEEE